jgi:hypothetical protein
MPWRCPACLSVIRHDDLALPHPRSVYRCHVCRLELTFDAITQKLIVAPLEDEPKTKPDRRRKTS